MARWLVLALVLTVLGDAATAAEPHLPCNWRFALPPGRAPAGEQVFAKMECYSCHTVAGRRFGDPTQNPGTPPHAALRRSPTWPQPPGSKRGRVP